MLYIVDASSQSLTPEASCHLLSRTASAGPAPGLAVPSLYGTHLTTPDYYGIVIFETQPISDKGGTMARKVKRSQIPVQLRMSGGLLYVQDHKTLGWQLVGLHPDHKHLREAYREMVGRMKQIPPNGPYHYDGKNVQPGEGGSR